MESPLSAVTYLYHLVLNIDPVGTPSQTTSTGVKSHNRIILKIIWEKGKVYTGLNLLFIKLVEPLSEVTYLVGGHYES